MIISHRKAYARVTFFYENLQTEVTRERPAYTLSDLWGKEKETPFNPFSPSKFINIYLLHTILIQKEFVLLREYMN